MIKKLFFRKGLDVLDGEICIDEERLLYLIKHHLPLSDAEDELLANCRQLLVTDDSIMVSILFKKIVDFKPKNKHEKDLKKKILDSIIHSYIITVIKNNNGTRSNGSLFRSIRNKPTTSESFEEEVSDLIRYSCEEKQQADSYRKKIVKTLPKTKR